MSLPMASPLEPTFKIGSNSKALPQSEIDHCQHPLLTHTHQPSREVVRVNIR